MQVFNLEMILVILKIPSPIKFIYIAISLKIILQIMSTIRLDHTTLLISSINIESIRTNLLFKQSVFSMGDLNVVYLLVYTGMRKYIYSI